MSTAIVTHRLAQGSIADSALKAATQFWFVVTVAGQLAFAFTVASFYGLTAVRGDYHGWRFSHGFTPGLTMGNFAVVAHLVSAVAVMFSGAVQLVPLVRDRFPAFHRWNGRIYLVTGVLVGTAGLYMTWVRGSVGDISQHLGSTLNAVLIWLCAGLALRYAVARDFQAHRRWALRLFLVVSASWFLRIGFFLALVINKRPYGFDPVTFTGPFLTFMNFAQYLVPLAVLEIYLWAKGCPGTVRRMATAALLFAVTLGMGAGAFAVTLAVWAPQIKAAFDSRKSIAKTLSTTIALSGIDSAIQQYHDLKASQLTAYNFGEDELNSLGYRLLRANKGKEAVRILQLNAEVYPQSSNVYDSLGEAYMDAGDTAQAIAYYQKALQINPHNRNSAVMLQKLTNR